MLQFLLEHSTLSAILGLLIITWLFNKATCGVCKSKARLDGKTVIITGCTSGIGKATAFDIAKRGARLIMAGIDLEQAHKVRESIVEVTKNNNVVVKFVDLSLMSSVRKFAEDIIQSEPRLDVLIHNAGVLIPKRVRTEEGLNTVWATNIFGPFLLTHLLINLIKKTKSSRIVFVSSLGHFFGSIDINKPNKFSMKIWLKLYFDTKFGVTVISNELARRLKGFSTVNCLHPGVIDTTIWDERPWLFDTFIKAVAPIICKTLEEGAQTTIYLAVSEEVQSVSGKFFVDCKEWPSARKTRDIGFAKEYWEICEKMVKLKTTDPHIV